MQPSFEQRGLLDFFFVGVAVPEGTGVDDVEEGGWVMVISVVGCGCDGSVGVLLLDGDETLSVDVSSSLSSPTVVDGSSGFPSSSNCTSSGKDVEADRNSRTFEIVCTGRTFNLIVLPPLICTWIAMLSAGSSLPEELEVADPDRDRFILSVTEFCGRRGRCLVAIDAAGDNGLVRVITRLVTDDEWGRWRRWSGN